ncbi:hypothetical protein [Flavobacterium hercynium]|uniref:Uncharacterized protein n=1 Tax=Flavobacterium hercynium TaxID=387094 RepID=A0A226H637_9FLAO|nr:hypothetical protein [Flavobacterium hercynium]OXA89514.1 hypothetical protein B0A66_13920 [Flavobacterium hercynium]SMP35856.1 hypothetical protein SAMN06265346_12051 [Flavobacterium hercynium]
MRKKKILITVLFVFQVITAQDKSNLPVYSKKVIIGFVNEDSKVESCNECYVLDTLKVLTKNILVKSEVQITKVADKTKFARLYTVEYIQKNKNGILKFNNIINSTFNELYIKNINGKLLIFRQLTYSNSSAKIKINEDDYVDFPSSLICMQNCNITIENNTLDFIDLFNYKKDVECFNCPNRYSLQECIMIKKKKQKFSWK